MRILIAEDDQTLGKFVREGLECEHYKVDVSADGEQARAAALENEYDVVILDLNLPRLDGITILRQLRVRKPSTPVLVLTQRIKVEDRVQCLDMGADDYLPKPFSFSELSARIRALLRRSHLPSEAVLQISDLKLDRTQRLVERAGRRIDLTTREFALLEYLMRNAGRKVTRSMIVEHVWNLTFDTTTNVVDVYASAQVDRNKVGRLAAAIQEAFQQLGAFPGTHVATTERSPDDVLEAIQRIQQGASADVYQDDQRVEEGDLIELESQLRRTLAAEIVMQTVSLRRETEGLVISLREFGFFDSGSANLRAAALPALDRIAAILGARNYRIRVEGHTDTVPIHTANLPSNWELSTYRASELVRLLIVRYGIAPGRLSAAGFAQYHPIGDNRTAQGRAQNRRVDIVILGIVPASVNKPSAARP